MSSDDEDFFGSSANPFAKDAQDGDGSSNPRPTLDLEAANEEHDGAQREMEASQLSQGGVSTLNAAPASCNSLFTPEKVLMGQPLDIYCPS